MEPPVSKRDIIFDEAKRLFGRYGYLGFTLKQLAQACDMTAPALYYFYSSKAQLFRDCLVSEFAARRVLVERCAERSSSLPEFARLFASEAIELCTLHDFRAGRAIEEIIHLPDEMQAELRASWEANLIAPVEALLDRVLPTIPRTMPRRLVASYIINLATFAAASEAHYSRDEFSALFVTVAEGFVAAATAASA
jgi:AcrR family transcriptional regulator